MVRFRSGIAALAIPILVLAGCGGDDSSGGAGLVAPPTRTPVPLTDTPAEYADSAGTESDALLALLTATEYGLGAAFALGWSPNGSQLFVSGTTTGWTYDAALATTPTALNSAWHGAGTFSPGGTLIAAMDGDRLALWDIANNTRRFALEAEGEQAWHVTFSPDDTRVAAVIMPLDALHSDTTATVYDPDNGIVPRESVLRVWDTASGAATDYPLPDDRMLDLTLTADERVLVVGSADNVTRYEYVGQNQDARALTPNSQDMDVRVWDLAQPDAPISTISARDSAENSAEDSALTSGIPAATLSADGHTLAAPVIVATSQYGTNEWRLNVWDATTGALLYQYDPNSTGTYQVRAFSPDGTILAAVANVRDNDQSTPFTIDQVWLWDVASGELITILASDALTGEDGDQIQALAFALDGATLAALARDGSILSWTTTPPADDTPHLPLATRADFTGAITALALSGDTPDSGTLYASGGGNLLRTWDIATGQPGDPITALQPPSLITTGPNNLLIGKVGQSFSRVQFWDTTTHAPLGLLRNGSGSLRFMALNPDGTTIATSRGGGTITFWDVTTSNTGGVLLATHQVSALAYSPDGALLATGGLDGTLILFDIASGDALTTISAHRGAVTDLAFSTDGQTLTSASLHAVVMEAESFGETSVTVAPDYSIHRFTVESRTMDGTLEVDADHTQIAALSADGSRAAVVTTTDAGAVLTVYAVADPVPLAVQSLDMANVTALVFSADGAQIVTGHADGTIRVWAIEEDE